MLGPPVANTIHVRVEKAEPVLPETFSITWNSILFVWVRKMMMFECTRRQRNLDLMFSFSMLNFPIMFHVELEWTYIHMFWTFQWSFNDDQVMFLIEQNTPLRVSVPFRMFILRHFVPINFLKVQLVPTLAIFYRLDTRWEWVLPTSMGFKIHLFINRQSSVGIDQFRMYAGDPVAFDTRGVHSARSCRDGGKCAVWQ